MPLRLYIDLMSQPSRSLYILLKKVNCEFEPKLVDLRKGAHYTEEYAKVNRLQKVPVIDHNGFVLTESVAIFKYLARENIIPESLYPKESKAQARVEEFLEWQHIGLRLHTSMYFRTVYMNPILFGTKLSQAALDGYESRMMAALEDVETKWLGRGHSFLVSDSITVADLLACCEIEQPRMAGFDARTKYPNIKEWMSKVQDYFSPYYEEAHVIVNKIIKKNEKAKVESKL